MRKKLSYNKFLTILHELYAEQSGFISYGDAEKELFAPKLVDLTYGEILPQSVNSLIKKLNLTKDDIFYDLGSGIGKVPLQVFLTTPVKKSYGIEAFKPRHDIAAYVYNQFLTTIFPEFCNNDASGSLASIEGNFLDYELSDATVIFIDSLCFEADLIAALTRKLNELPNLRSVISFKQLHLAEFKLHRPFMVECSWSKGTPSTTTYLYTKPNNASIVTKILKILSLD